MAEFSLAPVQYTPVDYDPFDVLAPGYKQPSPIVKSMLEGIGNMIAAPGRTAQGQQLQTPGQWSDLDEAQAQANARGLQVYAPQMAMNMLGAPGGAGGLGSGIRGADFARAGSGDIAATSNAARGVRQNTALAMDEASRQARLAEQGWGYGGDWYHGTSAPEFKMFNPNAMDKEIEHPATWLTNDSALATEYARDRGGQPISSGFPWGRYQAEIRKPLAEELKKLPEPMGRLLGTEAVADSVIKHGLDFEEMAKAGAPAESLDNIKRLIGKNQRLEQETITPEGARLMPVNVRGRFMPMELFQGYNPIAWDAALKAAKEGGWEGVHFKKVIDSPTGGGDPADVLAVFNPTNIRSKFAKYNPAAEQYGYLLGSGSTDKDLSAALTGLNATQGIRAYRAGDATGRGGATFYSLEKSGAEPYAAGSGKPIQETQLNPGNLFDAAGNGEHSRLYDQFLAETGHPARRGKNGLPFWTAEPELKQWLDAKGIKPDAIKFDENTGIPSVAVYQPPPSIRAYHGSPYDFDAERLIQHPSGATEYISGAPGKLPNVPAGATVLQDFPLGRMRMDKIGTGEGAQAYGHGLYNAEAERVAAEYKYNLAKPDFTRTKSGVPISSDMQRILEDAYNDAQKTHGVKSPSVNDSIHLAQQNLERQRADALKANDFEWYGKVADQQAELARMGKDAPTVGGKMYEVSINADPEHFLDWDKPLSEQSPKVQEKITKAGLAPQEADLGSFAGQPVGSAPRWADTAEQAGALRDAGIPGIKYLDQGSRAFEPIRTLNGGWRVGDKEFGALTHGSGQSAFDAAKQYAESLKTHNYVVFDDKLIDIIKKYGLAGLIAGGAAHYKTSPVDHDPFTQ